MLLAHNEHRRPGVSLEPDFVPPLRLDDDSDLKQPPKLTKFALESQQRRLRNVSLPYLA